MLNCLNEHEEKLTDIRKAAVNGNVEWVKNLLSQGVDVNSADEIGFSAFKYACGHGNIDVVRVMIPVADVND